MAHNMTPARRAALKKAQMASARKRRGTGRGKLAAANRKNMRLKRNIKRTAIAAGAVTAAGATVYVAHKHRGTIKKRSGLAKKKVQTRATAAKSKVKAKVVHKAENNHAVRVAATKHLMAEARAKKRPANNGLKMGKQYRMGRPDVRKKRKAAKYG